MSRAITPAELNSTEMGLLSLTSWLGVFLVASDGIPEWSRLEALVRRASIGAGFLALLGITQFVTGRPLTDLIEIPGLTPIAGLDSILSREGFNRPAGTALHPIEFGTVLTVLLPLCLHHAWHSRQAGGLTRWLPTVAVAVAIPLSISRSAIIGTIVVLLVLMPSWPVHARRVAYVMILGLLGVMFVLVPGMLGTISGLFTGISNDSSALSRTDSYALAGQFISRSPLFGRGFLTFLPEYRILDNQYLGMLIDCGAIGTLSLIALFCTALRSGVCARRVATAPYVRSLSQSLMASVAAAASSFAFFDAFSFPMLAGLTFLALGCLSALPRVVPLGSTDADRPGSIWNPARRRTAGRRH
jgi:O-antigen ligase